MSAQPFCTNCGTARVADAKFCGGCGTPVAPVPLSQLAPQPPLSQQAQVPLWTAAQQLRVAGLFCLVSMWCQLFSHIYGGGAQFVARIFAIVLVLGGVYLQAQVPRQTPMVWLRFLGPALLNASIFGQIVSWPLFDSGISFSVIMPIALTLTGALLITFEAILLRKQLPPA